MHRKDIKKGGLYLAKVNGKVQTVRVDEIADSRKYRSDPYSGRSKLADTVVYHCTNTATGRKIIFRSAAKFRSLAPGPNNPGAPPVKADRKKGKRLTPSPQEPPEQESTLDRWESLAVLADNGKEEAGDTLADLLIQSGLTEEQVESAPSWADAVRVAKARLANAPPKIGVKEMMAKILKNRQEEEDERPLDLRTLSLLDLIREMECGEADREARAKTEMFRRVSPPGIPLPVVTPASYSIRTTASSSLGKHLLREKPKDDSPHLIVEARAGTGKTTTLVQGIKGVLGGDPRKMRVKDRATMLFREVTIEPSPQQEAVWEAMAESKGKVRTIGFAAFNRSIADELRERVPKGCEAMTMHSMGRRAVDQVFKGLGEPNKYRDGNIIAEVVGEPVQQIRRQRIEFLTGLESLVSLCKMNLTGFDGTTLLTRTMGFDYWAEELDHLVAHYDVELGKWRQEIYETVPLILERCLDVAKDGHTNFDDMIWLPVVLGLPVYRYDMLLVDEAQDLNRCQQALARAAGSRLILCGDPCQAIYGFAGADADSMPRMGRELGADERGCRLLPLTVSRRCGQAIIDEAREIVPDIEAHPSNGPGFIAHATFKEDQDGKCYRDLARDGDMVLCRINAPLVSQCFRFLKEGRKANIQGRNIGEGLVTSVKYLSDDCKISVPDFVARVEAWQDEERAKELKKKNPSEAKLIAIDDRAGCLMVFAEGVKDVKDVLARITALFTDKDLPGIRLSSIHKAKGLEAKRVFFLEPPGGTCPHPSARSDWQMGQEMNLRYVAITRAIEELVHVT